MYVQRSETAGVHFCDWLLAHATERNRSTAARSTGNTCARCVEWINWPWNCSVFQWFMPAHVRDITGCYRRLNTRPAVDVLLSANYSVTRQVPAVQTDDMRTAVCYGACLCCTWLYNTISPALNAQCCHQRTLLTPRTAWALYVKQWWHKLTKTLLTNSLN